jgi:acyl carrier protein
MRYTDEQIRQEVCSIIAEVLRISTDEVKMDAVLGEELGAESLDFVDIQFRLEDHFNIHFSPGGLLATLSETFGHEALSENGQLTEFGAEVIRRRMPEIEPVKIYAGMPVAIEALYTPATWVRTVQELLDARPHCCSCCGSEHLKPVKPSRLVCDTCHAEFGCPPQEELLAVWAKRIADALIDA